MDEKKKRIDDEVFENAVNAASSGAAPKYAGTFDDQIKNLYSQIENRQPFQYDLPGDALYQQYKDNYIQNGKLAMKNAMGQAAGLTGGYGNSYAMQAGQQAFDAQMQNLSDIVPTLYGMAKDRYDDEGDKLKTQLGILQNQRDTEYDRYRDDVADWRYGQELDRAAEQRDYERRMAEDQTNYSRQQNAYSKLYALMMASGYNPTDDEIAAAGMSRPQAEALLALYRSQHPELFAVGDDGTEGGGSGGPRTPPPGDDDDEDTPAGKTRKLGTTMRNRVENTDLTGDQFTVAQVAAAGRSNGQLTDAQYKDIMRRLRVSEK